MGYREGTSNVRAVERAAKVLKCFISTKPELSLREISEELALPKSTVHRILQSLHMEGMIEQEAANGSYRLGAAMIRLGVVARDSIDIRKVALPILKWLSQISSQTSNLYLLRDNDKRVCVEEIAGPNYVRHHSFLGEAFPLHCGASGLVLMAYMPAVHRQAYYRAGLARFTENTIVDIAVLEQMMDNVRARGYYVSRGERDALSASIAAPVFDHEGHISASVAVTGALELFTDVDVERTIPHLLEASVQISEKMGYRKGT